MALTSGAMVPSLRHYTPPWNPKSGRSLPRTSSSSPAIIFALTSGLSSNIGNSNLDPHRRAVAASSSFGSTTTTTPAAAAALLCTRSGGRPVASSVLLEQQRQFLVGIKQRKLRKAGTPLLYRSDHSVGVQFDCKIAASTRPEIVTLDDVPHLSQWLPDLPRYPNPLGEHEAYKAVRRYFVEEDDVVAKNVVVKMDSPVSSVYFRRAGPRETVCFTGDEVHACIVTCGGLCPGLNTVIREIVCGLWRDYGVRDIVGIDGGYQGFYSENTIQLDPKVVSDIHKRGGTILGTSRGGHDKTKIVAAIIDRGINQVYIIGGDGTQKGAAIIHEELKKLGVKVVVVGIPKTVDNDIAVIDKSFGFDTAVEEAQRAINAAHVEAESVKNGIGLVKLMGRHSGSIAVYATLASRDVDCCLIPEIPFFLEGEGGLYEFARSRLRENGHMVIVVAEGADHELLIAESAQLSQSHDASGNRLLLDVGLWLGQKLKDHFAADTEKITLKYIDPTYMVRAVSSNASDNVYCTLLAHSAMHGAMAGYTGFIVGPVNDSHALIPIATVAETKNVIVTDRMWARLLSFTQQPDFLDHGHNPRKEKKILTAERDALRESTHGTGLQDEKGDDGLVIQPRQQINEVLEGAPQKS